MWTIDFSRRVSWRVVPIVQFRHCETTKWRGNLVSVSIFLYKFSMIGKESLGILIYLIAFLYTTTRAQGISFIKGVIFKRKSKKVLEDKEILDFVFEKTGLKLKKITLIEDDRLLGMMGGGLVKPFMILTTLAFRLLNKRQMQWLLLHEVAHNRFRHSLKIALTYLLIFIPGIFLIVMFSNSDLSIMWDIFLGVVLGVLANQITRNFEYSANQYAIEKMDNPKDAITAAEKIMAYYREKGFKDTLMRKLFNVWVLKIYQDLIKDANREIERRRINK